MSCKRKLLAACFAVTLALGAAGCRARREEGARRLAISRFENLSGETPLDWAGRALQELLLAQIAGSPGTQPIRIPSPHEAAAVRATHAIHGYYYPDGGRLAVTAVVEDLARRKAVRTIRVEGRLADGVIPLAGRLVEQIEPVSRAAPSTSEDALRAYVDAAERSDPQASAASLDKALKLDPGFGLAWLARLQLAVAGGDRAQADAIAGAARSLGGRIPPMERAEMAVLWPPPPADLNTRARAMAELAKLRPADADLARSLGEILIRTHQFPSAVTALRKAARLEPSNPLLWNSLGYACAWAGDLEGARASLERYAKLAPGDPNALDSMGDVHYHFGRFSEAEKLYLQAAEASPGFAAGADLYKAARSRLMAGDVAGAGALFRRYAEASRAANDPMIPFRAAQWEYLAGRRREAADALRRAASAPGAPRDAVSLAWSQLAVWALDAGDRTAAGGCAARAAAAAESPATRAMALSVTFLAQSEASASEWAARAERSFAGAGDASLKRFSLSYALLFGKHFEAAALTLRELYRQTPPDAPESAGVLLAWALAETGRWSEAAPLVEHFGVPPARGEQLFACLSFPRIHQLRGLVLERSGRAKEAQAAFAVYRALAGRP